MVCGAERLSFAALAQRAQAIADGLRAVGVARGDIVAVALPRSADSIAAVFGVFAAGAVYLPLDLDYPAERLATIAADARPRAIVTRRDVNPALAATPLFLDALAPSGRPRAALLRDAALSAGDAAYLIYTSGSTGTPKGVLATHGGLLNLLRSHEADAFGALTSARGARRLRAAHTTSFAFDAAWEQIIWLLLGQELHICDDEVRRDAQALLAFVHERAIDALDVPPVLLQALVDAGLLDDPARLPGLILTGSEAVPPALWRTLREVPGLRVCNCYGPTEYTVDALSAQLAVAATPVIGRPVARTRAYVLDRRLQPLPVGATGELYLAGAGLAHGYRGRAALTATRFVADPFVAGERMYRSGDCVRWRADGQLEFLGRGDRQVKIRGFRVEPGEVEQVLRGLPGVADAIVQAQTCGMTLRLVGYCTPTADAALDADMVRRELAARVPDYLVPAGIAVLAQWPLTTNGKIDRRALPDVTAPATARREAANPRERLICAGIAQVLGLPAVGADDDFFALGGDSISAMALGTQLRRDGYRLAPREIFAQRTPARMAAALTTLRESRARGAEADGAIGRLPIVAWFAEHCGMDSRYAQGVIVRVPATLNAHVLAQALAALQRAHPALRARAAGGVLVVGPARPLVVQDDTGDDGPFVARANRLFRTSAAALAPSAGHLMQATLLRGDGASWLLLVAHHLIVDGVSWRVLLPELRAACEAAASGAMPFVAPEETTLREWAAALAAEVPQRRSEIDQWRA
ncbi:amino acid adenylation domain-containing protein, partial [Tahibacter sp.]|uniref:amino acid adenylation domain-containing protein n=1 Tax=Tahibacter sp. TaxID=2056211 RepID=UPI0039C8D386